MSVYFSHAATLYLSHLLVFLDVFWLWYLVTGILIFFITDQFQWLPSTGLYFQWINFIVVWLLPFSLELFSVILFVIKFHCIFRLVSNSLWSSILTSQELSFHEHYTQALLVILNWNPIFLGCFNLWHILQETVARDTDENQRIKSLWSSQVGGGGGDEIWDHSRLHEKLKKNQKQSECSYYQWCVALDQ